MRLSELSGRRVYADTNVFIYAVERHPAYVGVLEALLMAIEDGEVEVVTSELTYAEVLVGTIRARNDLAGDTYGILLATDGPVRVIGVSRPVLVQAAQVRAHHGGKLPDAIHVATTLVARCDAFLTSDGGLKRPAGLAVVQVRDLTLD